MKRDKIFDLIIIGCGPAGMAASLYAARQKLDFLCISNDVGGLANFIPHVETYLGYHYLSGLNLVEKFQKHLKSFKINQVSNKVKKVEKKRKGFLVKTDNGNYLAKAVIVASGRKFKRLGVEGEDKLENHGVSYCAACDGVLFKGKVVAIIGGGRSGLLSSLFIKGLVKKIYLVESQPQLGGTKAWREAAEDASNIEILTCAKTLKIIGKGKVEGVLVKHNGKEKNLKVDGVFIEVGYMPNTEFLKGLVKLNDRGEVIVDKENRTNVAGIFAAGDCTDIREKQVIVAAGEGSKALLSTLIFLGAYE